MWTECAQCEHHQVDDTVCCCSSETASTHSLRDAVVIVFFFVIIGGIMSHGQHLALYILHNTMFRRFRDVIVDSLIRQSQWRSGEIRKRSILIDQAENMNAKRMHSGTSQT